MVRSHHAVAAAVGKNRVVFANQRPQGILAMLAGSLAIYSALFAIGSWITGRFLLAAGLTAIAVAGSIFVARVWARVSGDAARGAETRVMA